MIIYTKKCLACHDKALWKTIKNFCKVHNLPLEERRVSINNEWAKEAASYEIDLPFAVHGKTALSLNEDLEGIL